MPARRCSIHGINTPTNYEFQNCPICGEYTTYLPNEEPDEDYAHQLAALQEHLETEAAEPPEIPCVSSDVRVKLEDGAYYIHIWDLYAHGLRHKLRPDDLIMVGKQVFEILHYSSNRREYIVRPFSLELSDYDLRRLATP